MEIEKLKQEIPYNWRVQSFSKFKPEAMCVAYIDARQVMDMLDNVVGPGNWQSQFKEHKGNLFCSIGIKVDNQWVWKSDCGTESNMEKEKGEASDAFKRAAVMWGIGRFLYSLEIIKVPANCKKEKNTFPHVVDQNGKRVWDISEHLNSIMKMKDDFGKMKSYMTPDEIRGVSIAVRSSNWSDAKNWHDSINFRLLEEGTIWSKC